MAQIDANVTLEQLEQMEREFARKRSLADRQRRAELARLSDAHTFTDDKGTTWTYVIVDGDSVRITACETSQITLAIPSEIAGLPVRELGTEALSHLESPREIICAPCIESIGAYAFRRCENLKRLALPASTSAFFAGWVSLCNVLDELVLPDSLTVITADVVANPAVRHLVIGGKARSVEPGSFERSKLRSISVSKRNEHLATDGTCLYSADGSVLLALARQVEEYAIAPGCRRIAKKAFVGAKTLKRVIVPEGVEVIDSFAFAHSGIEQLDCPTSLRSIGPKICLHCTSLKTVALNEGLEEVAEEAFANSGLESLHIPASVTQLGRSITSRSQVRHASTGAGFGSGASSGSGSSGADGDVDVAGSGVAGRDDTIATEHTTANAGVSVELASFSIDNGNQTYFVDEYGCIYRRQPDGLHLFQLMEPTIVAYQALAGTTHIDAKAFAQHDRIESAVFPEGLKAIGDAAFKVCRKLRRVEIPSSVESVGKDAFIDTELEEFTIPASLVDIGPCALVTNGAHHEGTPPALRSIHLDERNPRFFMHAGMLCRRVSDSASVVMFTNSCERVDFPESIEAVEDYAFNNAFSITELDLNARLRSIGACGLSVACAIRRVRIDVAKPIEGKTSFVLRFPAASRSVHGFLLALSGNAGSLYLPDIMAQYDSCIASARDYHTPRDTDNASAYEQVKLIVERLNDSILLTNANRQRYHAVLADNIEEICVDIARHDDRATLNELADLGFLNADNLEAVVQAVGKLQDAAMTGYLLEMRRLRFSRTAIDFDL